MMGFLGTTYIMQVLVCSLLEGEMEGVGEVPRTQGNFPLSCIGS